MWGCGLRDWGGLGFFGGVWGFLGYLVAQGLEVDLERLQRATQGPDGASRRVQVLCALRHLQGGLRDLGGKGGVWGGPGTPLGSGGAAASVPPTTDTPSPGGDVGGETIPRGAKLRHGGPTSWGSPGGAPNLDPLGEGPSVGLRSQMGQRPPQKCPQGWTRSLLEQFTPGVPPKTSPVSARAPLGPAPPPCFAGLFWGSPMPAWGPLPSGVSPCLGPPADPLLGTPLWSITGDPRVWIGGSLGGLWGIWGFWGPHLPPPLLLQVLHGF